AVLPPTAPVPPTAPGEPVPTDPGRVTMRRLNRTELTNTIHDLLGLDGAVAADFPADDSGYGYDNVGDVLSTSALHVELMASHAEEWVAAGLGTASAPGPARARLLPCDLESGDACVRDTMRGFARLAYRRSIADEETTRLVSVVEAARTDGESVEAAVKLAMVAALVSPHFLFRAEIDSGSGAARTLNDHELASRLSYFLWASMPDEELLSLADEGRLHESEILEMQVERMLDDERARSLTSDFAGQWLWSRLVPGHVADYATYPEWTPQLAQSARREIELFFEAFLAEDRPLEELLTADFSFVDGRLADFYGIEGGPSGDAFVRVTMPPERQAGLLARAGVLAVTSQPNRTSPVKRGVWVLDQILCQEIPPPPPGVEGLDSGSDPSAGTVRERLEQHRRDPTCAACHSRMDPIGFGLEGFDGIGRSRTEDQGQPIDDSGTLPDGTMFRGAVELATILAADERYPRCVTRQMMTYALGRGMDQADDDGWVVVVTERARERGGHMRALVHEVVQSVPFRMRTPEGSR
ncbi:MAG: DUF1592 domain-containing protein, partial [Deltaproteobacteria bacterium]|nr:DUF1592 domain-containing protein [Deltaproteobacteria bacterium]